MLLEMAFVQTPAVKIFSLRQFAPFF